MTEFDPESISDNTNESDFVDQHTEVGLDDDVAAVEDDFDEILKEVDAWDADPADVADQQTVAEFDSDLLDDGT